MSLGNSCGKNKGKKYIKIAGTEVISGKNQQMYDDFSLWFADNYNATKRQLQAKGVFDHEIINDTFLKIGRVILYAGLEISDYPSYFHRAYFTNTIYKKTKYDRYVSLFEGLEQKYNYILNVEYECDYDYDIDKKYNAVVAQIKKSYPQLMSDVFLAYYPLDNKKTTLSDVSLKYNIPTCAVRRILKTVIDGINKQKNDSPSQTN